MPSGARYTEGMGFMKLTWFGYSSAAVHGSTAVRIEYLPTHGVGVCLGLGTPTFSLHKLRAGHVRTDSRTISDQDLATIRDLVNQEVGANSPSWMKDLQVEVSKEYGRRLILNAWRELSTLPTAASFFRSQSVSTVGDSTPVAASASG